MPDYRYYVETDPGGTALYSICVTAEYTMRYDT